MNPIAILGAGAIGQLIHRQLVDANLKVSMLARSANANKQLSFTPLNQADAIEYVVDWHQVSSAQQLSLDKVELLIVCVKAYQVIPALTPLLNSLNSQCNILLLHNGMGPHLALAELLKQKEKTQIGLSLGTTSQAALKLNAHAIKQTGNGLTQFGHFCGPKLNEQHKQQILQAIPNSKWLDDIIQALWQKLAINTAINPLTAIHQCKNGQLASDQYHTQIAQVVSELVQVAQAEGVHLDRQALIERVYQVISLTAENFSSMHQDVKHGRQTEILAINGYVCQRAKVHNIKVPENEALMNEVIAL